MGRGPWWAGGRGDLGCDGYVHVVDMETGHLMGRRPWCAGGCGDLGHDGYVHLVDMGDRVT